MNTTVVSGQNNMLANYLKADRARTFKALMQGHSSEDYYLGKMIEQPIKWKGQSVPMQSLRNMQSRSLFMVLFDNILFVTARLGTRLRNKVSGLASDWTTASIERSRIPAKRMALCTVLAVSILSLYLYLQSECQSRVAVSSSSIQSTAQSVSDFVSKRI
jgi:hypothetical protein